MLTNILIKIINTIQYKHRLKSLKTNNSMIGNLFLKRANNEKTGNYFIPIMNLSFYKSAAVKT